MSGGLFSFKDNLKINGTTNVEIVTGAGWLLEFFVLRAGRISFTNGDSRVRPDTKYFGAYFPPFSISQLCFENVESDFAGFAAVEPFAGELIAVNTAPVVFETSFVEPPASFGQAMESLNSGENFQSIEAYPNPCALSRKVKNIIEENYLARTSIARIAEQISVSHEHLSRSFKQDFGMSPNAYLNRLRIADAPLLLAQGEKITDVSHSVGYDDLSRFYKQFRRVLAKSPGVCRATLKSS